MAIEAAEATEPADVQAEGEQPAEQTEDVTEKPAEEAAPEEAKPDDAGQPDDSEKPSEPKPDEKPAALTVTLGEEDPPPPPDKAARAWALARQERREQARKIRELEERLAAQAAPQETAPVLPPEPTLSGCDYDEARLKAELVRWMEAKRKVDDHAQKLKATQEQQAKEWEATKATFAQKRAAVLQQAPDYEDAEIEVAREFSQVQQSLLMEALDNAPLVVLALHRNPEKLKELAAIKSPARFTAALARLEGSIKVMSKEPPKAKAEKKITGGAESSSSASLERALKRARETGDYTEYHRIKRAHDGAKKG
jgi:hypothetical protein